MQGLAAVTRTKGISFTEVKPICSAESPESNVGFARDRAAHHSFRTPSPEPEATRSVFANTPTAESQGSAQQAGRCPHDRSGIAAITQVNPPPHPYTYTIHHTPYTIHHTPYTHGYKPAMGVGPSPCARGTTEMGFFFDVWYSPREPSCAPATNHDSVRIRTHSNDVVDVAARRTR
jgi:hypothetical protein